MDAGSTERKARNPHQIHLKSLVFTNWMFSLCHLRNQETKAHIMTNRSQMAISMLHHSEVSLLIDQDKQIQRNINAVELYRLETEKLWG